MQVKTIAECSKDNSATLSIFIKLPFVTKIFVCLFLSGRLRQVLLYKSLWLIHTGTLGFVTSHGVMVNIVPQMFWNSNWLFVFNRINLNVVLCHFGKPIRILTEFYSWVSWELWTFTPVSLQSNSYRWRNRNIQFLVSLFSCERIYFQLYSLKEWYKKVIFREKSIRICFFGYAGRLLIWTTYPYTVWGDTTQFQCRLNTMIS